jgi:hypothetical protein
MKERTSHLAGLWIGAAISNTSHSNQAGSTTIKRAKLKVKAQGRWQCCHKSTKNFSIGLQVMYFLLSGKASYYISRFQVSVPIYAPSHRQEKLTIIVL